MVFALVVLASLQLDAATLAGRVVADATGSPIPGALVVLTDLGRGTRTDARGYYLLDVANVDDAIEAAAQCPGAHYGTIELRPLMEFEQPS